MHTQSTHDHVYNSTKLATVLISLTLFTAFGAATTAGHDFSGYSHASPDNTVSSGTLTDLQNAIDSANANDVIAVTGTYSGDITISQSLTLVADTQGGATIDGTVTISASDVTVKGFEITGGTEDTLNQGVFVNAAVDNVRIESNHIHGVTGSERATGVKLFGQNGNTQTNVVVTNNYIHDVKTTQSSSNERTIKAKGVAISEDVQGVEVLHNTIEDVGDSNAEMANGIDINTGDGEPVPQNFVIKFNKITDIDHGESLGYTPTAGGVYITGYNDAAANYGSNHKISNNQFLLSDTAATADIKIWDGGSDGTVNAQNNYWGADGVDYEDQDTMYSESAGNLADGSSAVDYTPWLINHVGNPPQTYKTDTTGTIQDAIDAASSGDTVKVAPGTYNEQVVLDKKVSLEAVSQDAVIHYQPSSSPSGQATVEVNTDGASITGFTVEREAHPDRDSNSNFAQGIRIIASNSIVKDNKVVGISMTDKVNKGIMVLDGRGNAPQAVSNVEITGNKVTGFHGGISSTVAYGTSVTDVAVTNNNVHDNYMDGINVAHISGTIDKISITGNTITGNKYGVHIYGDEDPGSSDFTADVSVHQNTVSGNEVGILNNGLATLDATHNYWGDQTGPERTTPSGQTVGSGDSISGSVAWRPYFPTKQAMTAGNAFNSHGAYLQSFDTDTDTNTQVSDQHIRDVAQQLVQPDTTVSDEHIRDVVESETSNFVTSSELDSELSTVEQQQQTIEAQRERINELESELEQVQDTLNQTLRVMEAQGQADVQRGPSGMAVTSPSTSGGLGGFLSGLFG